MFWKKKVREKAREFGKENFAELIMKHGLVFAFFEAPWCGACKILHPILDDLAHENKDRNVVIAVINTDVNRELSLKYNIRSLPTLVVFHKQEIIYQGPGMISKPRIQEMIDQTLAKEKTPL